MFNWSIAVNIYIRCILNILKLKSNFILVYQIKDNAINSSVDMIIECINLQISNIKNIPDDGKDVSARSFIDDI